MLVFKTKENAIVLILGTKKLNHDNYYHGIFIALILKISKILEERRCMNGLHRFVDYVLILCY